MTELESVSFDMADLVAKPRGAAHRGRHRPAGLRRAGRRGVRGRVRHRRPLRLRCRGAMGSTPARCRCGWRARTTGPTCPSRSPCARSTRSPSCARGRMTVGPGETATFDLRNMTHVAAARGLGRDPLRPRLRGVGVRRLARGLDRDRRRAPTARCPGSEEAAIVSVHEPRRRLAGPPHPARRRRAVDPAAGRVAHPAVLARPRDPRARSRSSAPRERSTRCRGRPLEVIDVRPVGACVGVTLRASRPRHPSSPSWAPDAPGATCAATFSVRDAQGRRTNAERDGQLLLDLLGYPKAPASVVADARTRTAASRCASTPARRGRPTRRSPGFVIRSNGQVVAECTADGVCPPIAAPNGEQPQLRGVRRQRRRASRCAVRADRRPGRTTRRPRRRSVTARPVVTGRRGRRRRTRDRRASSPTRPAASRSRAPPARRVRVPVGPRQTSLEVPSYRVGTNAATPITVTPFSRFDVPPGLGGSVVRRRRDRVGERHRRAAGRAARADARRRTATAPRRSPPRERARPAATDRRCATASSARGARCDDQRRRDPTRPSRASPDGEEYRFTACVESWYDDESFGRVDRDRVGARPAVRPRAARVDVRRRLRPRTSRTRVPSGSSARLRPPTSACPTRTASSSRAGDRARACSTATPASRCATSTRSGAPPRRGRVVTPRAGSAPYQVQARWWVRAVRRRLGPRAARRLVDRRRRRQGGDRVRQRRRCGSSTQRGAALPHAAGHAGRSPSARCGSTASA